MIAGPSLVSSPPFSVLAALPKSIDFVPRFPQTLTTGTPPLVAIQLCLLDSFGNIARGEGVVRAAFSNSTRSTLSGTLAVLIVNGCGVFRDLSINNPGLHSIEFSFASFDNSIEMNATSPPGARLGVSCRSGVQRLRCSHNCGPEFILLEMLHCLST